MLSQKMVPTTTKTVLTAGEGWTVWNNEFLGRTVARNLGGYIAPDSTEQLLTRPIRPVLTSKYTLLQKSAKRIKKYRDLRKAAQATTAGTTSATPTSVYKNEDSDGNQSDPEVLHEKEKITVTDLTADSVKVFQLEKQIYQEELAAYKEQDKNVSELKSWILDHVADHWKSTACMPKNPFGPGIQR